MDYSEAGWRGADSQDTVTVSCCGYHDSDAFIIRVEASEVAQQSQWPWKAPLGEKSQRLGSTLALEAVHTYTHMP